MFNDDMTNKNRSISVSNPFEVANTIIAECGLTTPHNPRRKMVVTRNELKIIMDTSSHPFRHADLRDIRLIHSKLLFFVISGGILVPLSLLGIFEQVMSTGLLLLLCLGGLAMLYHGLNGTPGLRIWSNSFFQTIPLASLTPALNVVPFLRFYKELHPQLAGDNGRLTLFARKVENGYIMTSKRASKEDHVVDLLKINQPVHFISEEGLEGLFVASLNPTAILNKS